MRINRRRLFGLLGGGVVGAAVAKFLPAAEPLKTKLRIRAVGRMPWPAPAIVDAGGSALVPEHFRMLRNRIAVNFGSDVKPDEWLIRQRTLDEYENALYAASMVYRGEPWRWDVPRYLSASGIPFRTHGHAHPEDEVLAPKALGPGELPVLLGKITHLKAARCCTSRLSQNGGPPACELTAGHEGLHVYRCVRWPGRAEG